MLKINRQPAGKKKALAYITGVYLGDGCLTHLKNDSYKKNDLYRFTLNTIDYDFAEKTKESLEQILSEKIKIYTYPVSKSSNSNNQLTARYAEPLFFLKEESWYRNRIPPFIWKMNRKIQKEFIAGVLDSEGFVSKNGKGSIYMGVKACDLFIDEFIKMLKSHNVKIGKRSIEKPRQEGYKAPIRYTINAESFWKAQLYLYIDRKMSRLRNAF